MTDTTARHAASKPSEGHTGLLILAWAWVTIPFLYGVIAFLFKVGALFS